MKNPAPPAIAALDAPISTRPSNYPPEFSERVAGRERRKLGDFFGLVNFGVNLTRLAPGTLSALRHSHAKQDEFIYILQGTPHLVTNEGESLLTPGMCAGFRAGNGNAHHLINRSEEDVIYLEIGDRTPGDFGNYPDDDLQAIQDTNGGWRFLHKDGSPY